MEGRNPGGTANEQLLAMGSLNRAAMMVQGALSGMMQGGKGGMGTAGMMAKLGWTPQKLREFLWEHSKIPMDQIRRAGGLAWIEIDANPLARESIKLDPWPIAMKPDNIILVVAGGDHPTHSQWLQAHSPAVVGRVIRTPEAFDRLLAESDRALGCGSDECRI